MNVSFCLLTQLDSPGIGKTVSLKNGKVEKSSGKALRNTSIEAKTLDFFQEFPNFLDTLKPTNALIYTRCKAGDGIIYGDSEKRGITKTRSNFEYEKKPGIMMFDFDVMPADIDALEYCQDTLKFIIGHEHPTIFKASAGANIFLEEKELKGTTGVRALMLVADTSEIPAIINLLIIRMSEKGLSRVEISDLNKKTVKYPIDHLIYQPERMDYAGGALCLDGLTQRRHNAVLVNESYPLLTLASIEVPKIELERAEIEQKEIKEGKVTATKKQAIQTKSESLTSSAPTLVEGGRNNGLISWAGQLRNAGCSYEVILFALREANLTRCIPALDDREVETIARSAARYKAGKDIALIASSVSFDSSSAEKNIEMGYHMIPGSKLLSVRRGLEWIVKGIIPKGFSMIFGESGVGKSFFAIDLACRIASGLSFNKKEAKKGKVVYLAGEGHYGFALRVQAWATHNQIEDSNNLDNLLVSSSSISINETDSLDTIEQSIRVHFKDKLISAVFIDTLSNHLAADENSAKDTSVFLQKCAQLSKRLGGAAIILIHHSGLAGESRARGSSAWKAAMDAVIFVKKVDDFGIEVVCTKLKESEFFNTLSATIESKELGWEDENKKVTGGVFVVEQQATLSRKYIQFADEKEIALACFKTEGEIVNNMPFFSKTTALKYLTENLGKTEKSAKNIVAPGAVNGFIYVLKNAGYLKVAKEGWIITDSSVLN